MSKIGRKSKGFILPLLFYFIILLVLHEVSAAVAQSFLPLPGDWSGITSQGNPVWFEVMDSRTNLRTFSLTYEKDCSGTIKIETWTFISTGDGFEIMDNQFSLSDSGRTFTGVFTSDKTSNGTFDVNYFDINIGAFCRASGTWFAAPEVLMPFKMFQPIILSQVE